MRRIRFTDGTFISRIFPTVHFPGIALILIFGGIAFSSKFFRYEIPLIQKPDLVFTFLYLLAGVIFLIWIFAFYKNFSIKINLKYLFVYGLILRIMMIFSTPILEDDFYRYLWDGAVVSQGINPYKYSPEEILAGADSENPELRKLNLLGKESGKIILNINHKYVRSIYPPVTQAAFALAYLLKPWSLISWRLSLLIVDLVTLAAAILLLRQFKLPGNLAAVYWLNPLLIKEVFNSGHMDILLFPFLLLAIFLAFRRRYLWAVMMLGMATGVKFWPVLLLPFFLILIGRKPRKLITATSIYLGTAVLMIAPLYLSGFDKSSAVLNYSQRWELNDALFKIFVWLSQFSLKLIGIHPGYGQLTARILVAVLLLTLIIYFAFRLRKNPRSFIRICLFGTAALFLLSPTQFPWYFLWLIPFLVFIPYKPLLLLIGLLPAYYLRYYFEGRGMEHIFDYGIVWIEYLPVWILIIRDLFNRTAATTNWLVKPDFPDFEPANQGNCG